MEVGEEWSLDTIGPQPADESGNTYIMVAIVGFSRFVVLEPASDASGESVARFLLKLVGWFTRAGGPMPLAVLSVWAQAPTGSLGPAARARHRASGSPGHHGHHEQEKARSIMGLSG
jgi:hypothetical protein